MKITYDREGDIISIKFLKAEKGITGYSRVVNEEDIIVKFTEDGRIYCIDILDASERFPADFLKTTAQANAASMKKTA